MSHWYTKNGDPLHWVDKKDGGTRPTTLRDARKFKLRPSVTDILKVADKPALTRWKVEQAYLAAMTLPHLEGETLDEFIARAKIDAEQQVKDSIDIGQQMHAAVEAMYLGNPVPYEYTELTTNVHNLIVELTGIKDVDAWVPEKTFATADYGGMIDLHTRKNGGVIIDFKSKDFDEPKKLAWPEMDMQLSAYAHGIDLPNARRINIFLSRTKPGLIAHHEWEPDDDTAWRKFQALLEYWKLDKGYDPNE